jgi:hypothetical protein
MLVLASTFLGMVVPASMPFQIIVASTIVRPLSMVALVLMPFGMVFLALTPIWVRVPDLIAVFMTVALTTRPLGMGMVATALKNAALALTAISVVVLASMAVCLILASTTRPLGMGMVVLASLLLSAVIQALTPILVAVLALMASTMINGFSTPSETNSTCKLTVLRVKPRVIPPIKLIHIITCSALTKLHDVIIYLMCLN